MSINTTYHRFCLGLITSIFVFVINATVKADPISIFSSTSYHLPAGSVSPFSIARSSDNTLIATENTGSNTVTVFKLATDGSATSQSYALKDSMHNGFTSVMFQPASGSYLAVASGYANGITMFRVGKDGLLSPGTFYAFGPSSNPGTATFSPNGLFLVTANNADVSVFSVGAGGGLTSLGTVATVSGPKSMAFSPDGSFFATANYLINKITVFGPDGGKTTATYNLPAGSKTPFCVAYSPDGSYLATANYGSNDVTMFKVGVNGVLSKDISYDLPAGSKGPAWLAFSSEGSYLATANRDSNDITIFTVTPEGVLSQSMSYSLPDGSSVPSSIIFASDDSYLATTNYGSDDITLFRLAITSSVSDSADSGSDSDKDLGLILGIAFGVPSLVAVLGVISYCFYKKKWQRRGYTSVNWGSDELTAS